MWTHRGGQEGLKEVRRDQIAAWYEAILDDLPPESLLNDEVKGICYDIAIQSCGLRRVAEMKRVLSSERFGPA